MNFTVCWSAVGALALQVRSGPIPERRSDSAPGQPPGAALQQRSDPGALALQLRSSKKVKLIEQAKRKAFYYALSFQLSSEQLFLKAINMQSTLNVVEL